jgi:hypothetical protein
MRSSVLGSGNVARLTLWAMLSCIAGCGVPPEATLLDPAALKASSRQSERGLVWMFPGLVGVP